MRLGGCDIRAVPNHHALKFSHLLHAASSPPPPPVTGFSPSATASLERIYGNNYLGDCVRAAAAHRIGLLTGAANPGRPFIYTDAQVIAEYSRVGGYVPGDESTDNGCDPVVSANDGVKNGYADGSKDLGWVAVDASSQHQVALAFYLTENSDLSMAMPNDWVGKDMPSASGAVWDVAGDPVPENGHNVEIVDYDVARGVLISTWGILVWVTWAALAKYGVQSNGGILISHVNPDQIIRATMKAPTGIEWATLLAFFDQDLGGHVPVPAPTPAPTPSPSPVHVSLEDAQAWAREGIYAGSPILTHRSAARCSDAGLTANWPRS